MTCQKSVRTSRRSTLPFPGPWPSAVRVCRLVSGGGGVYSQAPGRSSPFLTARRQCGPGQGALARADPQRPSRPLSWRPSCWMARSSGEAEGSVAWAGADRLRPRSRHRRPRPAGEPAETASLRLLSTDWLRARPSGPRACRRVDRNVQRDALHRRRGRDRDIRPLLAEIDLPVPVSVPFSLCTTRRSTRATPWPP